MSPTDGTGRKPPESKSSGPSVVLYIVAVAAGVTLLAMLFVRSSSLVIDYRHLLDLIDAHQPGVAGSPGIEIAQRQNDRVERLRLRNPREIRVGDRVVRGIVDVEPLGESGGRARTARGCGFRPTRAPRTRSKPN